MAIVFHLAVLNQIYTRTENIGTESKKENIGTESKKENIGTESKKENIGTEISAVQNLHCMDSTEMLVL